MLTSRDPSADSLFTTFVQWFVQFLVILVCVGEPVPGVNESHYLPKAKHAWDSGFAPGDIFLESHNSHFVATSFAGFAAQFMSLPMVAWIGRLASWGFLSWAWIHFSRSLRIPSLLSPFALAAWYFATAYGHWAGEWAIGGFEAKSIAYPCVLLGLAGAIDSRWRSVWIWMGLAVAWHPVVGGWAGLSVGLFWLWKLRKNEVHLNESLPGLALGTALGFIGVLPALTGMGGNDRAGNVVASQVHVYYRLAHHMCPRTFEFDRHMAACWSLLALIASSIVWRTWLSHSKAAEIDAVERERDSEQSRTEGAARFGIILAVAWISVMFAVMGLMLDLTLSRYQPVLVSKLLRFYWFRWSDIAVPLAWTSVLWGYISDAFYARSVERSLSLGIRGALVAGIGSTVFCAGSHISQTWSSSIPAADTLLVESRGPHAIPSDRYIDWLAVCAWIQENTPEDSLWLTPQHQQTFKWFAHRAEVVCWKDVPQDNASILEWYDRVQKLRQPRDRAGVVRGWTTQELVGLRDEFGFEWVLVDRTIQTDPPLLEIVYPVDIENRSFAIFRVKHDVQNSLNKD